MYIKRTSITCRCTNWKMKMYSLRKSRLVTISVPFAWICCRIRSKLGAAEVMHVATASVL